MDIDRILIPELADYAKELVGAGFSVYVFTSDVKRVDNGGKESCATHLGFSRVVGDQVCFASVSYSLAGFQFDMPMKPSRQHGSSMFIGGADAPEFEELTVRKAELYASPTGRNLLVGTQANDPAWCIHLYSHVRLEAV